MVQEATLSMRVRVPEGNIVRGQSNYYQLGTNIIFWYTSIHISINISIWNISQIEYQGDKHLNVTSDGLFDILYVVDWEEMMNEPRLDLYPLDYDDANHAGT